MNSCNTQYEDHTQHDKKHRFLLNKVKYNMIKNNLKQTNKGYTKMNLNSHQLC